MLDDEQQLVVLRRVALGLLRGQQQVETEVVAVRHPARRSRARRPGLEVATAPACRWSSRCQPMTATCPTGWYDAGADAVGYRQRSDLTAVPREQSGRCACGSPDWPCPVGQILAQHRRGRGDPTYKIDLAGRHWRGLRTPTGPGHPCHGRLAAARRRGRTPRPGARVPSGRSSRCRTCSARTTTRAGFEPRHPVLATLALRCTRTGGSVAAAWSWRRWCRRSSSRRSPARRPSAGFRVAGPAVRRAGSRARARPRPVDPAAPRRRCVPSRPGSGSSCTSTPPGRARWCWPHGWRSRSSGSPSCRRRRGRRRLRSRARHRRVDQRRGAGPGAGRRRRGVVRRLPRGQGHRVGAHRRAHGRPRSSQLYLEPWRPHRGRVQALVAMTGLRRPRRGPRMAPRTHLPAR